MKYGLIGEKLGHSFSVEIHGKVADYSYELKELSPEALGPFLEKKEYDDLGSTVIETMQAPSRSISKSQG